MQKISISLSAVKPKTVPNSGRIVLPRSVYLSAAKEGVVAGQKLLELLPAFHAPLDNHNLMAVLAKSGLRTPAETVKHAKAFFAKATPSGIKSFYSAAELMSLVTLLKPLVGKNIYRDISKYNMNTGKYNKNTGQLLLPLGDVRKILESVVRLYAYIATKLCAVLAVPYSVSITQFLLTGKGTKIPAQIKTICSKSAVTTKTMATLPDSTLIEDLKLKDFKGGEAFALVGKLPDLYKDYIKRNTKKTKAVTAKKTSGPQPRYMRMLERQKKLDAKKDGAADKLKSEVGDELFNFYSMVIPALKPKLKKDKDIQAKLKILQRQTYATVSMSPKRGSSRTSAPSAARLSTHAAKRKEDQARIKTVRAQIKKLKDEFAQDKQKGIKAWMLPYVSSKVDIDKVRGATSKMDKNLLAHRLVVRANAGKLKKGDAELKAQMTPADAMLLTYRGASKVIDACGGSSKTAFKTVFSTVIENVKSKVFTVAMMERNGRGLETATGKVTNEKLLRLNSITLDDEKALTAQFKKDYTAWDPTKLEIKEAITKIDSSTEVKAAAYTVTASSAAQLKAYAEDLPQFMSHLHSVNIKLVKSWEVKPSKQLLALLKNTKTASKLRVIRNVFHGCAQQTGSIILHSGFKITGTMKTARSMGDVLYLASCVDKSAQYLGGSGLTRKEGTTGIIFMGDCIVSGSPAGKAPAIKDRKFGWTKTSAFRTEEIGLINPNMQFIIKHVFLIKVSRQQTKTPNALATQMKKFENPVPLSTVASLLT